jgi:glycerol-3-phosphate dehydrogenase
MYKIAVLGAGTWGIAIASLLANNGHKVDVYVRDLAKAKTYKKTRSYDKLPGLSLDASINFYNDIDSTIKDKDIIVFAIPSNAFREVAHSVIKKTSGKEYLITLTKGMEDKTLYTMSEIIEDELKKSKIKNKNVAALSGPTHAEEVAKSMPTLAVAASKSMKVAKFVQDAFMNENFRVYTNTDIKGVEICAAFKNIIGLASGVLTGLGFGDNIKAALLTRGLAEMTRVGKALSCKKDTFYGLAGIGDMIVTAISMNSRNYRCGKLIGEGHSVDSAIKKIGMVVEGVNFIPRAIKIERKYKLELPITRAMYEIIIRNKDPRDILKLLMVRSKKSE